MRDLKIPFVGLKEGKHSFNFELDDTFFAKFDSSPIEKGNVQVNLVFDKHASFFDLHFEIDGTIITECDRCAEDFELDIFGDFDLYVKFNDPDNPPKEEEAEVIWINRNDTHLDLAQTVYEFVVLSLPMTKNCGVPGPDNPKCKVTNLELLKSLIKSEDDIENEQKETEKPTDPRWEALLKLKSNK